MLKKLFLRLALLVTIATLSWSALAAEPTIHEVYQAAQQGRYIEAQAMMDQVLQAHPNSAKAHFAEAELLARQGLLTRAQAELRTAEQLQPGLAFATPQAVSSLKALIAAPHAVSPATQGRPANDSLALATSASRATPDHGLPWGLLLGGLGLIAFIYFAAQFMKRRTEVQAPAAYTSYGNPVVAQPYGSGYAGMGGGAPGAAPGGSGLGSGIMGGLATGAALGAGMVAGQALMHHFTDGDRSSPAGLPQANSNDNWVAPPANDMGGRDFGMTDNTSWDSGDSSSSGGSDSWD